MGREIKRVAVRGDTDLMRILEEVRNDKQPRIVEREGEGLAAIIDLQDLSKVLTEEPTREDLETALKAAGAWRDIDAAALKRYIYEGRERGTRPAGRPA